MKKYAGTALVVAITLITTLSMNFGLSYLFRNKGSIVLGNRIATQSTGLRPVDITNQSVEEARYVTDMARRIAAILLLTPALDASYRAVKQAP
jgi:hypothetical protein